MAVFVKCFPWQSLVRLKATFTKSEDDPDDPGGLVDPDTVTVRTKDPNGDKASFVYLTDLSLVREDEGVYHYDVDASLIGDWFYRWEGTGSGQAAAEGKFTVSDSPFAGSP